MISPIFCFFNVLTNLNWDNFQGMGWKKRGLDSVRWTPSSLHMLQSVSQAKSWRKWEKLQINEKIWGKRWKNMLQSVSQEKSWGNWGKFRKLRILFLKFEQQKNWRTCSSRCHRQKVGENETNQENLRKSYKFEKKL